jgi:glycosyltransferase involved in cell wall biosynthesis
MIGSAGARRKIGVFHPGTQHSWQTSRALQELNELAWYATSILNMPERLPYSLVPFLPKKLRKIAREELRRFDYPALDPTRVHLFGIGQWAMRISYRLGWRDLARLIQFYDNTWFAKPVNRLMQNSPVRAAWGYDLSSLEVFETARSLGLTTILDRTIGHPRAYNAIIEDVHREYPEFFVPGSYKLPNAVIERSDREHELADIITVGSEFCRSTLTASGPGQVDNRKIRTIEYCFEDTFFSPKPRAESAARPIRFLFLGQAGPRKGIHLLLKVMALLPKNAASLTIVGDLQVPSETFRKYSDDVTYVKTVPRADVFNLMRNADCLVFPSYFEGAGLVLYEALACGLCIIQSKNAAIVAEQGVGIMMNELTEAELFRCMTAVIENPRCIDEWRTKIPFLLRNFTFDAYKQRVAGLIRNV